MWSFMLKTPDGQILGQGTRGDSGGVHLDVDMNRPGTTIRNSPIEHFVVPHKNDLAPGKYVLYVIYYSPNRTVPTAEKSFKVSVKIDGKVQNFSGTVTWPTSSAPAVCILTVDENKRVRVAPATNEPALPLNDRGK